MAKDIETLDEAKGPQTKSELLALVMKHVGSMKKAEIEDFVKSFSDAIPSGAAASNQASVSMSPSMAAPTMHEDVEALFGDTDLSEEFKEKTTTLFEAAVTNRVELIKAELEEEFETKHDEQVKESIDELNANIDSYLDYVAEKWVEENKLAIEEGFRAEITENFLSGLRNLFAENYVEVPEDKVDLVDQLQEQVNELKESLESVEAKNIKLSESIEQAKRSTLLEELSEDLTETQAEKFATLTENVDFDTEEKFKEKLQMIKEQYFTESKEESEPNTGLINEDASIGSNDETEDRVIPEEMRRFVDTISRTARK